MADVDALEAGRQVDLALAVVRVTEAHGLGVDGAELGNDRPDGVEVGGSSGKAASMAASASGESTSSLCGAYDPHL